MTGRKGKTVWHSGLNDILGIFTEELAAQRVISQKTRKIRAPATFLLLL